MRLNFINLGHKKKADQYGRRTSTNSREGRDVFSYYASRSNETATLGRGGQPEKKGSSSSWHYLPSLIAAIAIIISLGYLLILSTNPRVIVADHTGVVALRPLQTYQEAAHNILNSSLLNRNKFTVDTSKVARTMKQQFPELEDVAVTLPITGHRPLVELATAKPALIISAKNGQFVVSENGRALAVASDANKSGLKNLITVSDNSGLTLEAGKSALPTDQVTFISQLIAQLKAQSLKVESLTLPAAPDEMDVRVAGLPYFVKFNTALDVREQVGSFLAAKQKLDAGHTTPSEYMDVRVEEKVFYK